MNEPIVTALVHSFGLIVPEVILGLASCLLFLGSTFRPNRHVWGAVALAALVAAGVAWFHTPTPQEFYGPVSDSARQAATFAAPLYWDQLALLIKIMGLVGGVVLVLMSWNEVPDRQAGEFHACLLLIVAGLGFTGMANDLITLFLALELISIPTYILLYLPRHDNAAQEAAMKYFLLSVFSSALLLFGFSYLYGLTGTTNIPAVVSALTGTEQDPVSMIKGAKLIALVMVTAGLCFRITAVPFHHYAPDVYQGAPTSAAALLAFIPKVAGFVALVRLLGFVWAGNTADGRALSWHVPIFFWILAAVTMSLGNILALLQHNLKRLLAYSSVAHAGYMLIGLAVAYQFSDPASAASVPGGVPALLFYLAAYGAMTVGAFAVLSYLSTPERPVEMEDDLAGLSLSHPGVALTMALFLFSLIGIPLTAGFAGKLFLFMGAMAIKETDELAVLFRWLALIGAINAAIGAWYYLRILSKMYLHTPVKPIEKSRPLPGLVALWICAGLTLALGIRPALLLKQAGSAAGPQAVRMGVPQGSQGVSK